jgi:hypothetical protein
MDAANKESVHPGGETVKWDETIESLRGAIGQADDAVDVADEFRDEWVKKVLSCPCKSPSSCEEKEQETILGLLMEAEVSASKWEKAISYALTMRRRAELIVDTLLPIIDEEVERKALAAVKVRSKWLEAKWQPILTDVEMVNQYTTEAVQRWKAVTLPSRGLGERLDARSAYQAVEKVYQIAGWGVGWYTNWEGSRAYREKFSKNLFSFQFILDHFSLPHEIKDVLLQLEARSSLNQLEAQPFLNSILDSMGELVEISQAEATKNMQRAILTADEEIARMIHFIDHSPVDRIARLIRPVVQTGKILADVKNWTYHWEQMVTSVGNAIWQIVQTTDVLLSTVGKDDEQKVWIEVKNAAKKQFQSWYPYMYGIKKLYDHTVEAEANQRYLPNGNFASWYHTFSVTTEAEKNALETILCIRYQFNWMFLDYEWSYMRDLRDYEWNNRGWGWRVKWHQNHFAQISQDWTLFAAKLLEPGTPSSSLFVDTQNQDNQLYPSLHFMENSPSQNIEQEVIRWVRMRMPRTNQLILQAIGLMWKWPKNKEVSLLKANESLEILKEVKNWVSDLSRAMSTARYAIHEMVDFLKIQSIISQNLHYERRTRSILDFWDVYIPCITTLSQTIANTEASWQQLVISKEVSTTNLSLNATSVNKTKIRVAPSAKIHVNICVSLDPDQVHHTWSEEWPQKDTNFITQEEKEAVDRTRKVVDAARRLRWGLQWDCHNRRNLNYPTGQYIDRNRPAINCNGQIEGTTHISWTPDCISYDWMRLRHDLLNL